MLYVAVDIGCIECGEDSAVLGVFEHEEQARATCADHAERQKAAWHGQHDFLVYEVAGVGLPVRVEYR